MMKKVLSSILMAAFVSSVLIGCGGSKPAAKAENGEKKESAMSRRLKEKMGGASQEATVPEPAPQEQAAQ